MAIEPAIAAVPAVDFPIHNVRGQRVMLDSNLARIYSVTTMRLGEQFRRNRKRFPSDFAFQLDPQEFANLKSQIAISSSHGGRRSLPWVFTEHGAIMLASVLNSPRAVEMSVFVVRAFVKMREVLSSNRQLAAKLEELEKRVGGHDETLEQLVAAIRQLIQPPGADKPRREIGFHVRDDDSSGILSRRR